MNESTIAITHTRSIYNNSHIAMTKSLFFAAAAAVHLAFAIFRQPSIKMKSIRKISAAKLPIRVHTHVIRLVTVIESRIWLKWNEMEWAMLW